MRPIPWAASAAILLAVLAAGCKKKEELVAVRDETTGDAARGHALVQKFECARCHSGFPEQEVKAEKACVGCHEQIMTGMLPNAAPEAFAKWRPLVQDLRYAPSLTHTGRFRAAWLEGFLQKPHDLRPGLRMNMPRLAISKDEARDLAAYFKTKPGATPEATRAAAAPAIVKGDAAKGEKLMASKGCNFCHRFSGGPALAPAQFNEATKSVDMARSLALAPDLRWARDRMTAPVMAAWILKPSALKPSSDMPDIPVTEDEARDLTTFIMTAPLAASTPTSPAFQRLPVLERPVRFDEVNAKVFHRTCWHCHSEPDFAIGDGGPGNSGGFGFLGKGIDLSSFQGVMAGFFERVNNEPPKRKSLASPTQSGAPRLLAALLARHAEEGAGADTGEVRGMPLGLPPLPAEDIQLVETWLAQGRPR